jgi:hypothetical protein
MNSFNMADNNVMPPTPAEPPKADVAESRATENGLPEPGAHATANGGDPASLPGLTRADNEAAKKPGGPKVLLTGFVPSELTEAARLCHELALEVTSQAKQATHVVMPKLNRTISLLCAISFAKFVVSVKWLQDSAKEKKLKGELRIMNCPRPVLKGLCLHETAKFGRTTQNLSGRQKLKLFDFFTFLKLQFLSSRQVLFCLTKFCCFMYVGK